MNNKHKPKYISVEPLTLTQAITNLFNEMSPRDYMAAPNDNIAPLKFIDTLEDK